MHCKTQLLYYAHKIIYYYLKGLVKNFAHIFQCKQNLFSFIKNVISMCSQQSYGACDFNI